jgi:hypothetical protein
MAAVDSAFLWVGLQLIARNHAEAALLSAACLLEQELALPRLPIDPRPEPVPHF